MERKKVECCLYSTARMFVEWRISVGYDSVLRCSVWEYIGIKYFSLVHAYRIIIIVEYLDCDFVGVRTVSDGSGVVGREACFEYEM